MKEFAIYIIYEWLWHEVDSGVDYYLSAGGQGVDTSMDHVWTVFQQCDWSIITITLTFLLLMILNESPSHKFYEFRNPGHCFMKMIATSFGVLKPIIRTSSHTEFLKGAIKPN